MALEKESEKAVKVLTKDLRSDRQHDEEGGEASRRQGRRRRPSRQGRQGHDEASRQEGGQGRGPRSGAERARRPDLESVAMIPMNTRRVAVALTLALCWPYDRPGACHGGRATRRPGAPRRFSFRTRPGSLEVRRVRRFRKRKRRGVSDGGSTRSRRTPRFRFDLVTTVGDNLLGSETPAGLSRTNSRFRTSHSSTPA